MITLDEIEGATPETARKMLVEVTSCLPLLVAKASIAPAAHESESLLTVEETAKAIGMSADWVYRNHRKLPFRKVGRALRFRLRGIEEYISRRKSG